MANAPKLGNLASLDVSSLLVLAALLDEQSVTKTAEHLGVTQSAVSHALAKLRRHFGDPLFVRGATGMLPTERAEQLREPLQRLVGALDAFAAVQGHFDPSSSNRAFTIMCSDLIGLTLVPTVLQSMQQQAPASRLIVRSYTARWTEQLETGRLDLAFLPQDVVPDSFRRQVVLRDEFAVLRRAEHPRIGDELDLERYLAEGHVVVAPKGATGSIVDARLRATNLSRRWTVRSSQFVVAVGLVARSELLLTAPRAIANGIGQAFGLRQHPTPIELPSFSIVASWHERSHRDPHHQWLRSLFTIAAQQGAAEPGPDSAS